MRYRSEVAVHVAHRSEHAESAALARALLAALWRNPATPLARGIGIPVLFHTEAGGRAPLPIDEARHVVLVPLVDDAMVLDDEWAAWIEREAARLLADPAHRLLPVDLGGSAGTLGGAIAATQTIALHRSPATARTADLVRAVTHRLCELLLLDDGDATPPLRDARDAAPRVSLFLSHAKQGGLDLTQRLRDALRDVRADTFFDAVEIPPGADWARLLEERAAARVLIAVQTDGYSTRPWCRREVLAARLAGQPLLVVDALRDGEARSFPYLGGAPVVRWDPAAPAASGDPGARAVVDAAFTECLRRLHHRRHLAGLAAAGWLPKGAVLLDGAPDLLTLQRPAVARAARPTLLVYPDPPLGREELDLLAAAAPGTAALTPTQHAAAAPPSTPAAAALSAASAPARADRGGGLDGVTVAISIGDPPAGDLAARGLAAEHLAVAFIEFARQLLAAGATVAYGGRPGLQGFLAVLVDLVVQHRREGDDLAGAVQSFLAWPYGLDLPVAERARVRGLVRYEDVPPPADLDPATLARLVEGRTPGAPLVGEEARGVLGRSLTAMRERVTAASAARVLLGGKREGASGRWPGVVEEAVLALRAGRPLYVLGGFGGGAALVLDALAGRADAGARRLCGAACDELAALAGRRAPNGLDDDENRRLAVTPHLPEMIRLVMKGLRSLRPAPGVAR